MNDDINGSGTNAADAGDEWDGQDRRRTDSEALRVAQNLSTSMNGLADEIRDLRVYGRHNRQIIAALLGVVLVVAALLVFTISVAKQAEHATSLSAQNKQNAKVTCLAGNEARAAQVRLWTYVLDVSTASNPSTTPQQAKFIADFRAYILTVFAARDCDNPTPPTATPTPPVPPPGFVTPTTPTITPTR